MADGSQKGNHLPPPITATPKRSILKHSTGETDEPDAKTAPEAHQKCDLPGSPPPHANFDEMNIIQTHHPADKDYGHMKIDEPKTPYNGTVDGANHSMITAAVAGTSSQPPSSGGIDPSALAASLNSAIGSPPRVVQDLSQSELSDDEDESPRHNTSFQNQRKQHYNEYHAVQAARQKTTLPPGSQGEPPKLPFNDEGVRNSAGDYVRGTPRPFERVVKPHYESLRERIAKDRRLAFEEKRRLHDRNSRSPALPFMVRYYSEIQIDAGSSDANSSKGSQLTFNKARKVYDRTAILNAIAELTAEMESASVDGSGIRKLTTTPVSSDVEEFESLHEMIPKCQGQRFSSKLPVPVRVHKNRIRFQIDQSQRRAAPLLMRRVTVKPEQEEESEEKIPKVDFSGRRLSFEQRRYLHCRGEALRGRDHFYGGKPYKLPPMTPPPIGHTLSFIERRELNSFEEFTRATSPALSVTI